MPGSYPSRTWSIQLPSHLALRECTVFTEVWLSARMKDAGEDKGNYQIYTSPVGNYDFLKSALNRQEKWWKDPVLVNLDAPDPKGIGALFAKRFTTTKN